ncbi:hypothetical protein AN958_06413 [Leucoagaricus sp. SymC.cos]|nr:hypothetical protein AN958_06413 [Leucoagaricus sp. SymC.cos]
MRDFKDFSRVYRPAAQEIQKVARAVVQVLAEHNFNCCLFGSTAAAIYGAENRNPRDVDMIVLVPPASPAAALITIEEVKQLIADNSSSDFYLVDSRDPLATHKILYYILTPSHPDPSSPFHHACKVDLLLPGMIGIPKSIPVDALHYENYFPDVPLLPFGVLILLKVRAWSEHRLAVEENRRGMKEKVKFDEADIEELLDLGINEYLVRMKSVESWATWEWVDDMKEYVRKYVEKFPESKPMWEEMGVSLKSEWSLPPRGWAH